MGDCIWRRAWTAVSLTLIALAIAPAGEAAAAPPLLREFCSPGAGAGQCIIPRGIGTDPSNGDIYVADQTNRRLLRFNAWGEFLRTWGRDVVASGPGDDTIPPEDEFEICVPSNGDVCKAGINGTGAGQINGPNGVAVDSAGNVYLFDRNNSRVQKFDPAGNFLLMVGGKVNKTKVDAAAPEAAQNRCPVDPGDVCQAGTQGTGNGQFGAVPLGSFIAVDHGSPDTVYVGDVGRIQKFDTSGNHLGNLLDPDAVLAGQNVQALAVDPVGDLYVALVNKEDVFKLSPAGEKLCTTPLEALDIEKPRAIATDAAGNVWVADAGPGLSAQTTFHEFGSDCLATGETVGQGEFGASTGVATSSACRVDGVALIVDNAEASNSFARIYGPPPDPSLPGCPDPPVHQPTIRAQHALSVDTDSAMVRAEINPHFWGDTSFYVEYGTGKCSEGGCDETALFPGAQLGAGIANAFFITKGVFLGAEEPLQPDTTYHYRFVAESDGGGPVFGEGDEACVLDPACGEERTFRTFPTPRAPNVCPNREFRTGASAHLPDCRAYELVSPLDKGNSDLSTASEAHDMSSASGDALTYATLAAAYGDPLGAPYAHQYLSTRDPSAGWSTRSISPPRRLPPLYETRQTLEPLYTVFSEDLCNGWVLQDTDVPLAAGAPESIPNLYRRDNCGAGEGSYETITSVAPPGWGIEVEPADSNYWLKVQGASADGTLSVFRAPAALTQEGAAATGTELECSAGVPAETISYQWLRDGDPIAAANTASYEIVAADEGKAIQCQVFALNANAGSTQVANPAQVVAPYPATAPPLAPAGIAEPAASAPLTVGSGGGQTLTCDPNEDAWEGSPTFSYQWYRNGAPILGATAVTYTPTAGDLASAAAFQCAVTATNAGGSVVKVSANRTTSPAPDSPPAPNANNPGMTDLYRVYASHAGELHLVSVLPNGGVPSTHSSAGTAQGKSLDFKEDSVSHAVSVSGSRIFWSVSDDSDSPKEGEGEAGSGDQCDTGCTLYLRINPTLPHSDTCGPGKACSIQVAANVRRFVTAAADGSVAIYQVGDDLFEFDVDKALASESATTEIAGNVMGVMGASEDASRVYLLSGEELDAGAAAGQPNLYLYEQGVGLTFVATLSKTDLDGSPNTPVAPEPGRRTSRVSPSGLHAAFTSVAPLTGFDNTDVSSGEPDAEVFLYDATANGGDGELVCASCNPSGVRPRGRQVATGGTFNLWAVARIPGWISQLHPGRFLSNDGRRLFFESFESLVPRDTNGKQDVYEWERAADKDACESEIGGDLFVPQSGGCLSLISSGESEEDSELVDASASGSDVFFVTQSSLLVQDYGLRDIYDARELGGFPPPPAPPPPCEGEACQGIASTPEAPTPASSAFQGPGNLKPGKPRPRCPKGKRRVRRNGKMRCVKRHRKRQHRARHDRRAVR